MRCNGGMEGDSVHSVQHYIHTAWAFRFIGCPAWEKLAIAQEWWYMEVHWLRGTGTGRLFLRRHAGAHLDIPRPSCIVHPLYYVSSFVCIRRDPNVPLISKCVVSRRGDY